MSKIALSSDDDKRLQALGNIPSYPYETNAFNPIQDGVGVGAKSNFYKRKN